MANNPKWCKPLNIWKNYFTDWITTPVPQNLLDASVFFDFRSIYGDESFTERLKRTVDSSIKDNPLFLYHLAYNTSNSKPPHILSGNILSDKNADAVNLKTAVTPFIMFARTYSLQNNIWCSNTIERLSALKEKNIISEYTIDEIVFGYDFLMKLRFRNQAYLSENNMPLSNSLNSRNLVDPELFLLKKVLTSIPDFQNKIKADFRITT
jgi:CBS domain-containing protein